MSGIEFEEISQTKNSLEVDDLLEDSLQTEGFQASSKTHKHCHKTNRQPAPCWKYFKIKGEES
ncbi:5259_t:CDS:1, partial [Cetraspora pellucida]